MAKLFLSFDDQGRFLGAWTDQPDLQLVMCMEWPLDASQQVMAEATADLHPWEDLPKGSEEPIQQAFNNPGWSVRILSDDFDYELEAQEQVEQQLMDYREQQYREQQAEQ